MVRISKRPNTTEVSRLHIDNYPARPWVAIHVPGSHLLHEPDHVSATTREGALTKARAIVDRRLC